MSIKLKHTPLHPPRDDHDESIYARRWGELNENGDVFAGLMANYMRKYGQREATIIASFICWLGTNVGMLYLSDARRLSASAFLEDAYLAAWAIHNKRSVGVSSGYRLIEVLLAEKAGSDALAPTLCADDYECADLAARWLSTPIGLKFIDQCEAEIERLRKIRTIASYHKNGMSDAPIVKALEAELAKMPIL